MFVCLWLNHATKYLTDFNESLYKNAQEKKNKPEQEMLALNWLAIKISSETTVYDSLKVLLLRYTTFRMILACREHETKYITG